MNSFSKNIWVLLFLMVPALACSSDMKEHEDKKNEEASLESQLVSAVIREDRSKIRELVLRGARTDLSPKEGGSSADVLVSLQFFMRMRPVLEEARKEASDRDAKKRR